MTGATTRNRCGGWVPPGLATGSTAPPVRTGGARHACPDRGRTRQSGCPRPLAARRDGALRLPSPSWWPPGCSPPKTRDRVAGVARRPAAWVLHHRPDHRAGDRRCRRRSAAPGRHRIERAPLDGPPGPWSRRPGFGNRRSATGVVAWAGDHRDPFAGARRCPVDHHRRGVGRHPGAGRSLVEPGRGGTGISSGVYIDDDLPVASFMTDDDPPAGSTLMAISERPRVRGTGTPDTRLYAGERCLFSSRGFTASSPAGTACSTGVRPHHGCHPTHRA